MAARALLVCLLLVASAGALRRPRVLSLHEQRAGLHPAGLKSKYAHECGQQGRLSLSLAAQSMLRMNGTNPGAGMEPQTIQPFKTVLKDGFLKTDCVTDSVLLYGDKFGDGKDSYKLGDVSNISIVHYADIIAEEDAKPMTQEICFEFCRTVPLMAFFGIANGRDCYCSPYYQATESDDSKCDAVCEGNPTQMCGSKLKSSIFSMHECGDTAENLKLALDETESLAGLLEHAEDKLDSLRNHMQESADEMHKIFGEVGDPHAADLMQKAKVFAGELAKEFENKGRMIDGLFSHIKAAEELEGKDFTKFDDNKKAESVTEHMKELAQEARDAVKALDELLTLASPSGSKYAASAGAAKQYYPLMHFVNEEFSEVPSTCAGSVVQPPMANVTIDECAHSCDAHVHDCVGFSYFSLGDDHSLTPLCFVFEKFTEVTYYTGCNHQKKAFLQGQTAQHTKGTVPFTCMAKLSEFEGTSLKPDSSGKCKGCLKEATEAARCPV